MIQVHIARLNCGDWVASVTPSQSDSIRRHIPAPNQTTRSNTKEGCIKDLLEMLNTTEDQLDIQEVSKDLVRL